MLIRMASEIGQLIREARRRQDMTQSDLARKINATVKWVSHIENGKPTAEIGLVLQALTALGVEMDFRLPSSEPKTPADADDASAPYKL